MVFPKTKLTTIQAALDTCAAFDTVLVQPGVYYEKILWGSKNGIKLLSAGDSSNTEIDANSTGRVMEFRSAAIDTNTLIKGFTLRGGYLTGSLVVGAGILMTDASPKFEGVAIRNNELSAINWAYGTGVYCDDSSPVFFKCSVSNNITTASIWGYGGGMYIRGTGTPRLRDTRVENNSVTSSTWNYGAGIYCLGQNLDLENVCIVGNLAQPGMIYCYGTGLYLRDGTFNLTNVLIAGNTMPGGANYYYGSGISSDGNGNATLTLMNVTIADNIRSDSGAVSGLSVSPGTTFTITNSILWNGNLGNEISGGSANSTVTYSCIRNGYQGAGNIALPPLFDTLNAYHLTATSPCAGSGTAAAASFIDLDNNYRPNPAGTNPDMGCYEINQTSVGVTEAANGILNAVFPNPFNDNIYLNFNDVVPTAYITVMDISGKKVIVKEMVNKDSFLLDTTELASGIYLLEIIQENKITTVKLVKQ